MEIVEKYELFEGNWDDLKFKHTKVIVKDGEQLYYAKTPTPLNQAAGIDPQALDLVKIDLSKDCPSFPENLTRASDPLPLNVHVKQPSLASFDEVHDSAIGLGVVAHEAQICEVLKASSHPNLAEYHGRFEENGKLTGPIFTTYGPSLASRAESDRQSINAESCLADIRRGMEHLHRLGIVHGDINPSNIFTYGNGFVVGDFDSCARDGEKLE